MKTGLRLPVIFAACAAFAVLPAPALAQGDPYGSLDFRRIVREATDAVFPAVVYVKVVRESHEFGEKKSQAVTGSGVIISPEGEVLTNWHVVDKALEVRCLLADGRHYDADVVGTDKDTDLALIKLVRPDDDASGSLPYASFGDSEALREGDFVMAMGAPWGLNRSVSIGIVSCTSRYLDGASEYSDWLQTDAAISPGNSGGPLVNTKGEVIGINTRGIVMGGDTGFSVPSNMVEMIASQLREHGAVNWSWTGLQLQPIRDFDKDIYFDGTDGVIVSGTDPESPARRAGFLAEDRIVSVNGTPIAALTSEALPAVRRTLGLLPKYEEAAFTVWRGGERVTLTVTPREKGEVEGKELDCPRWDFTAKEINQFDNPNLHFHRPEGVFIYGVKYPGNASNAGLQQSDIILNIGGDEIATLDDLRRVHEDAVARVGEQPKVMLTVLRSGLMRQVVLDFSRDFERE